MSNMYPDTATWNSFVGCKYGCLYCEKSFKRQLKRVAGKTGCQACYDYEPHYHPERLNRIPSSPIVFVYGTGDISFCEPDFVRRTFNAIDAHRPRKRKLYYFQSKNPQCFEQYLDWFNEHQDTVILLTTQETNRDAGYSEISKAPPPSKRFWDFYRLDYPRKVLTIEPVLDFDLNLFVSMVMLLQDQGTLEYIWFGYDSKNCGLPEPSIYEAQRFVDILRRRDVKIRGKTLRGVDIHVPSV